MNKAKPGMVERTERNSLFKKLPSIGWSVARHDDSICSLIAVSTNQNYD
ncbi:hypothetical protein [Caballeronia terrestris]|nr:hypothetical protein [Caballeronia terrestris]